MWSNALPLLKKKCWRFVESFECATGVALSHGFYLQKNLWIPNVPVWYCYMVKPGVTQDSQKFVDIKIREPSIARRTVNYKNQDRLRTDWVFNSEEQILERIEESPNISSQKLATEIGVSNFIVRRTVKEQGLLPMMYKRCNYYSLEIFHASFIIVSSY